MGHEQCRMSNAPRVPRGARPGGPTKKVATQCSNLFSLSIVNCTFFTFHLFLLLALEQLVRGPSPAFGGFRMTSRSN